MKTLKKLAAMVGYLFSKLLNCNPELNTKIAIAKGKVSLEKFFDSLAEMNENIKTKNSRIDELKTDISIKWDKAIQAALLVKNKVDVTIALTNKKACDVELVILEQELKKDIEAVSSGETTRQSYKY